MTNAVAAHLMNQIDQTGLLFNVSESEMFLPNGMKVPNKKAIINERDNKVMGVVSSAYKVVSNEQIFEGFTNSIAEAKIDTEGSFINVTSTPTMSKAMVEFVFPAHEIAIQGDDSKSVLRIAALNSFDGSTRYITKAGALRMKCMNGQILGNIVGSYSSTHSSGLDVETGSKRVVEMIEQFNLASDYFGAMMKTPVKQTVAQSVFTEFLGMKEFDAETKNMSTLLKSYDEYSRDLGHNVYAVYNTLTDFVTHRKPRSSTTEFSSKNFYSNKMEKVLPTLEDLAVL